MLDLNDLRSFIPVALESHFPIQNLPFGVFSTQTNPRRRIGVAIGEYVLELATLERNGLFHFTTMASDFFQNQDSLNDFMAHGPAAWREVRGAVSNLLREDVATLRDDQPLRASSDTSKRGTHASARAY